MRISDILRTACWRQMRCSTKVSRTSWEGVNRSSAEHFLKGLPAEKESRTMTVQKKQQQISIFYTPPWKRHTRTETRDFCLYEEQHGYYDVIHVAHGMCRRKSVKLSRILKSRSERAWQKRKQDSCVVLWYCPMVTRCFPNRNCRPWRALHYRRFPRSKSLSVMEMQRNVRLI